MVGPGRHRGHTRTLPRPLLRDPQVQGESLAAVPNALREAGPPTPQQEAFLQEKEFVPFKAAQPALRAVFSRGSQLSFASIEA